MIMREGYAKSLVMLFHHPLFQGLMGNNPGKFSPLGDEGPSGGIH